MGRTHVGLLAVAVEQREQHIDGGVGLDGDAGLESGGVDLGDECGAGRVRRARRLGGLVVEAVQVAAGALEIVEPLLRLQVRCYQRCAATAGGERTSATIMWQSNTPLLQSALRSTAPRMHVTTGEPMVMLGTKCPSIMSMCSQSAPSSLTMREHSWRRLPKSEARMDGAMIALGAMLWLVEGLTWSREGVRDWIRKMELLF